MKPRPLCRLAVSGGIVLATALEILAPAAAGGSLEVRVPLDTPRSASGRGAGGDLGRVPFVFHLPDPGKPVRGVYLNPFYLDHATKQRNHQVCAAWGLAAAGTNLFGVKGSELGATVNRALDLAAERSGRPELRGAPLLLVGMSAGAGMAVRILEQLPDQVIAVGAVCLEVGPPSAAAARVPTITVVGERDGKQLERVLGKLPEVRTAGAGRWAVAVQWGRKHEFHRANNVLFPFFDAVVRERLDAGGKLQPWPAESEGWVGSTHDWSTVAPAADSGVAAGSSAWLPGADAAAVWRAAVSRRPVVELVHPAPQGGGNPLALHPAGAPLRVTIRPASAVARRGELDLTRWRLFAGARELARFDASGGATAELPAGVYGLWAGHESGEQPPSRPTVVVVTSPE